MQCCENLLEFRKTVWAEYIKTNGVEEKEKTKRKIQVITDLRSFRTGSNRIRAEVEEDIRYKGVKKRKRSDSQNVEKVKKKKKKSETVKGRRKRNKPSDEEKRRGKKKRR